MPEIKDLLEEYVATANNPEYNSDWGKINQKFPELKDYDPDLLQEYVATANNPEYKSDFNSINAKFPELFAEKKKPTSTPSLPTGFGFSTTALGSGQSRTQPTNTPFISSASPSSTTGQPTKQLTPEQLKAAVGASIADVGKPDVPEIPKIELTATPGSKADKSIKATKNALKMDEYVQSLNTASQSYEALMQEYAPLEEQMKAIGVAIANNPTPEAVAEYQALAEQAAPLVDKINSTIKGAKILEAGIRNRKQLDELNKEENYTVSKMGARGLESVYNNLVNSTGDLIESVGDIVYQNYIINANEASGIETTPDDDNKITDVIAQGIDKYYKQLNAETVKDIPESFQNYSPLTDKPEARKLLNFGINATAQLAPTVAAAVTTGGIGAVATGFAMEYGGMYDTFHDPIKQKYIEQGLSEKEAEVKADKESALMALAGTTIIAQLDRFGTMGLISSVSKKQLARKVALEALEELGERTGKEAAEAAMKKALTKNLVEFGKGFAKSVGQEVVTEPVQELVAPAMQDVYNTVGGETFESGGLGDSETWKNAGNAAVGALMASSPFGTVAGVQSITPSMYQNIKSITNEAELRKFQGDLQAEVEAGITTPEQAEEAMQNVQKVQEVDKTIPDNIQSPEERTAAVNLLIEKQDLETSIEGKDKALIAPQTERIKEIDGELTDIATGKFIETLKENENKEAGGAVIAGNQFGLTDDNYTISQAIGIHERAIKKNETELAKVQAEYDKLPSWKKKLGLSSLDNKIESLKSESKWRSEMIDKITEYANENKEETSSEVPTVSEESGVSGINGQESETVTDGIGITESISETPDGNQFGDVNEMVSETPTETVQVEPSGNSGQLEGGDKSALGDVESTAKKITLLGIDIGFDKPNRKDYKEGVEGDSEYAKDNLAHTKKVDDTIGDIKEEGTLIDSAGNEYYLTITGQGVRVVNKLSDGSEGSDISYRKGKRISPDSPFKNGFTFKSESLLKEPSPTTESTKGETAETVDVEGVKPVESPVNGAKNWTNDVTPVQHRESIRTKFSTAFRGKNVPQDQIDGALALMDARAKSWASEEKGRKPEDWYGKIADIKNGEFSSSSSNILFQILDDIDLFSKDVGINDAKQFIDKVFVDVKDNDEAKKAFRKMSIKYHPDRSSNPDADDIMKYLNKKRDDYDKGLIEKKPVEDNKPKSPTKKPANPNKFDFETAFKEQQRRESEKKEKKEKDYAGGMSFSDKINELIVRAFVSNSALYKEFQKQYKQVEDFYDKKIAPLDSSMKAELNEAMRNRVSNPDIIAKIRSKYEPAIQRLTKERDYKLSNLEIELKRKSKPMFQDEGIGAKGAVEFMEDGKLIIHALESPDFSTMVHELAHVFETDLNSEENIVVKNFGGSEAFARGFERYLRDGSAPTKELQNLFDKFKQWLSDIYQSLKGSPIEKNVTPEIKNIFDRLLKETTPDQQTEGNTDESKGKRQEKGLLTTEAGTGQTVPALPSLTEQGASVVIPVAENVQATVTVTESPDGESIYEASLTKDGEPYTDKTGDSVFQFTTDKELTEFLDKKRKGFELSTKKQQITTNTTTEEKTEPAKGKKAEEKPLVKPAVRKDALMMPYPQFNSKYPDITLSEYNSIRTGGSLASKTGVVNAKRAPKTKRVDISPNKTGEVKRLDDIVLDLTKGVKKDISYSKYGRARALGSYQPSNAATRIKYRQDLDTTAHEIGHALDDRHGLLIDIPVNKLPQITAELMPFAEHGSTPPKGYANPQQYILGEGVAEWIRAYVVNPDAAISMAPEFYAHYESIVPEEIRNGIKSFSNDVRNFAGQTNIDKLRSTIAFDEKAKKKSIMEFFKPTTSAEGGFGITFIDRMKQMFLNRFHFADIAFKYAMGQKGMDDVLPQNDPRVLGRLFLGVNDKVGNMMDNGFVDARNERVIDQPTGEKITFKWLVEPLDSTDEKTLNEEYQSMSSVMVAQRVKEVYDRFKKENEKAKAEGQPIPHTNINQIINAGGGVFENMEVVNGVLEEYNRLKEENPNKHARLEEGMRRFRVFADQILRYQVEKGRMSLDQYREIKKENSYYVGLGRILDAGPGEEIKTGKSKGKSLGSVKEFDALKGSTRMIKNPYEFLLETMFNGIVEADRNEVMTSFVDMLDFARDMYESDPGVNKLSTVGAKTTSDGDNTVKVYRNGEAEYYKLDDDVYATIKNLDSAGVNIPKFITALPSILRWTVTNFPVFAARNRVRDFQSRLILSQSGTKLSDIFKKDKTLRDRYELFGGGQAGYYMTEPDFYYRKLENAIQELSGSNTIVVHPWDMAKKGWDNYTKLLAASERATRLEEYSAAYRKAKGKGLDDYNANLYAAFQSRDLMDFAVAGTWMREINKVIPFTNAAVQGLRKMVRTAGEDPSGFAVRLALYSIIPAVFTRMMASIGDDDDEWYQRLPSWQRDLFYNFKVGDNKILAIPKPYELGAMGSFADRLVDKYFYGNDKAFEGFDGTVVKSFMPFDEGSIAGPAGAAVETIANYDFFRNKNIVPPDENKTLLELRNTDYASRLGKRIQDVFGVDARKADFLVKRLFSYYGDLAIKTSDIGREGKGFGWETTGFIKPEPGYSSRDVQWILDKAVEVGLPELSMNAGKYYSTYKDYRTLKELTYVYYAAENDEQRSAASKTLRDYAAKVRQSWEEGGVYNREKQRLIDYKENWSKKSKK